MRSDYSQSYFATHVEGSAGSADVILPIVCDLVKPATAVDVGCGAGTWVSGLLEHGVDAIGIDGHANPDLPPGRFVRRDLAQGIGTDRQFDLAMSLEVVEHLPPSRGRSFVEELVQLAPCILFAAAVPFQGGVGHVNEQPASHWTMLFELHDFEPFDVVRPKVWADPGVRPWYKQNCLLFVHRDHVGRLGLTDDDRPTLLDVIHPELFALKLGQPHVKDVVRMLPGAVRRRLRRSRGPREERGRRRP